MSELKIFNNEEFGQIRTLIIDGEPWFVGKDVAEALGFKNPRQGLATNVADEDKGVHSVDTPSGTQQMTIINESGLYALIFGSKLESAKRFKHWVTSEVLPTIRKTGFYILKANQQYKANLLLSIYNGGQEGVLASRELTKIEIEEATLPLKKEIAQQQETIIMKNSTIETQKKEIYHKDEVNKGLVKDISLAEKRQILNRVVRKGAGKDSIAKRWSALYREFEQKYHMNLGRRIDGYNDGCDEFNERNKDRIKSKEVVKRKKVKTKVEYIDIVLNQISDLYDLACKLYENDVTVLVKELYDIINPEC